MASDTRPNALFVGDLDDPWVAGIAAALPEPIVRLFCPADLPEPDAWPVEAGEVPVWVIHRAHLGLTDEARLRAWRDRAERPPEVVLCVGPHARYHQAERWASWVDVIVPEATAVETIARHVPQPGSTPELDDRRPVRMRPSVTIISQLYELRRVLVDVVRRAGYPAELARDWSEAAPGGLVVWDVPMLEPGWPATLDLAARGRQVVALMGFADRESVDLARRRGAAACLDLPCEAADLGFVLGRLARGKGQRVEPGHALPPAPKARRT